MTIQSNARRAWRAAATMAAFSVPAAAALAGTPASTSAAPAKTDAFLAKTLAAPQSSGWSSVILKTNGVLSPTQEAQLASLSVDITRRLPIIQSVSVRVPSRNLDKLAALPFITHLSLDGLVKKNDEFTVGSSEANQATAIGFFGMSYRLTGQGVTVAVVDSGIANHPDLNGNSNFLGIKLPGSRILANVNFVANNDGKVDTNNAHDDCGHGTHIAGIIAGNGTKSCDQKCYRHFFGIAPAASLVNVRVLDQNGTSDIATVITGIQWVVNNANRYNIRVINLSLGHPVGDTYLNDPLCQAVEAAYQAGIIVVCAAGNEGRASASNTPGMDNEGWGTNYGSIQSPGNDPYVITVGATKNMDGNHNDDCIATYSSRGPSRLDLILKPDIIAPGNKVISLCANNSTLDTYAGGTNDIPQSVYITKGNNNSSHDYFQLSGTSMAAPVVTGAAALLLQADPTLTPDTIKARLMLSADKWDDPMGNADALTYGSGYLNIPAALQNTTVAQGPAISPELTIDPSGNVSIAMDRAVWGKSLWGTGITDLRAVWGKMAVAGDNTLSASRAVWGKNSVASSSVWADRAVWGKTTTSVDLTSTAIQGE